ncbi:MAG: hypothetical protein H6821_05260 [Planctomycetaceae bacterium]|nr:hypothetical protein [Planctomycetaceae bacterium]
MRGIKDSGAIRFVTPTVTSPTLKPQSTPSSKDTKTPKHITFDAFSSSAILVRTKRRHSRAADIKLGKPIIVAFGADSRNVDISVEFTAA